MSSAGVHRADEFVDSEPGVRIYVRTVRAGRTGRSDPAARVPIVLVHGGGPGGLASFDLPVPGYSLAADLAAAGHAAYVMDVRGWGRSTRPAALEAPADANPPAVRCDEAARDIAAVVSLARAESGGGPVALLGWASGGHWGGLYAATHSDAISHLVLLNSLYGVDAPWGMNDAFEAEDEPGTFDRGIGAYGLRTGASLIAGWDRSIPFDDKAAWRDAAVADAYVAEALASDPRSAEHDPPAMRVPSGFQLESWEMAHGRRYWEASSIRARTLVIRGERDFWSRPVDLEVLERELTTAAEVRAVTIGDGTHYVFNDRPERGRAAFIDAVLDVLR